MTLTLNDADFVNGRYTVNYARNMQAQFIIVDESFPGDNNIGRVNKIVILVRTLSDTGEPIEGAIQSSVIGLGNRIVGVKTNIPELRGKVLSKDNMAQCTIILYEDGAT